MLEYWYIERGLIRQNAKCQTLLSAEVSACSGFDTEKGDQSYHIDLLFSLQAWLNRIQLVEFCLFLVLKGFKQGNVLQEMNV